MLGQSYPNASPTWRGSRVGAKTRIAGIVGGRMLRAPRTVDAESVHVETMYGFSTRPVVLLSRHKDNMEKIQGYCGFAGCPLPSSFISTIFHARVVNGRKNASPMMPSSRGCCPVPYTTTGPGFSLLRHRASLTLQEASVWGNGSCGCSGRCRA